QISIVKLLPPPATPPPPTPPPTVAPQPTVEPMAEQKQMMEPEAKPDKPHTRDAALRVQIKIWPDKTGRIARVDLDGSTGDPIVDSAIKSEALNGLQLQEPPPADLPLPIVLRITARRPDC